MSVIQQIQEKYAKLMAIIIAIALIIFVVMLAFENGGSLLRGSNSDVIGKVNGEEISGPSFRQKVDQYETYLKQQYGPNAGSMVTQQAIQNAWEAEVGQIVLKSELDKLGLRIGKRELGDILYGANPPQELKQQFSNAETGIYDAASAKRQLDQVLKSGTPEQKANINAFISQQEFLRLNEKYSSLLNNSFNYPKWMVEKENTDNSQLSKISFVREVYASIPDSTVTVSDKEVEDYVGKHKDEFKQEESRSIEYVSFSAQPTAGDTAAALKDITTQKAEFDTTADPAGMTVRYGSSIPYTDVYFGKTQLQTANQQMQTSFKDTILTLPKNAVFGPYLEGGNYVMAKMLDSKILPDSIKCRHILLGTADRQGQPLMDDSIAHHLADSIATAIKGGANFDSLEAKFSTDQQAHLTKGEMTFASSVIQGEGFAPEFGKFLMDGKPGDKQVVKTQFGWHYIEILDFIKPEIHFKIAYLAKAIEASSETDANANNAANQFAGQSRSLKAFDDNAEKLKAKGINKLRQDNISPNEYRLQAGESRTFVKAIYAADAGDVLPVERIGDNYVVAAVTEINKKGTQSVAKARPVVESILRNHKKAEQITKKIGSAATLEAVATALGGKQIEVADSLRLANTTPSLVSAEPKVIGAAFNPANKAKISPVIEGTQGVYVIRIDNLTATSLGDANVAEQRKARADQKKMSLMQMMQQGYDPNTAILKEAATIKDNRNKFY